jgi:hypothetical protein
VRIDVRGSAELRDVILALKNSGTEVRRAVRAYAKAEMVEPWRREILNRSATSLERKVISATATISVSDQNIRVQSAAKGRKLRGGLQPKYDYGPVEFGMQPRKTAYTRKGHRVIRTTGTSFKGPNRSGYVFYPAAREMIPRLASLWVQTVVKVYADIFSGKG